MCVFLIATDGLSTDVGKRQHTEMTEDTLLSVGRHVIHVCPVCLNEWKLSLFSASCRPGGGPQQRSAARVYHNISFCRTEVLLPRGSMSSGVYPLCFANTWQDEVIVCFPFKIWKSSHSLEPVVCVLELMFCPEIRLCDTFVVSRQWTGHNYTDTSTDIHLYRGII